MAWAAVITMTLYEEWVVQTQSMSSIIRKDWIKMLVVRTHLWKLAKGQSQGISFLSQRQLTRASLVAQTVKNLPAMQETMVQSLGREDPLEKGMATHSSILAWRIPWMEEPGGLQYWGCKESNMTQRLIFHFIFNSNKHHPFPGSDQEISKKKEYGYIVMYG